ncbi:MAG: peptide ABC transporter, periplasmic peptide-binding protein [Meiothermus sp.]|nr:MAG: peptide ABC transporter, periplasmic peptide-binding protein [Meiothermus sp.]
MLPAYTNLGVTAGKAGGSLTLSLASAPQTFFYYGAIDSAIQNLANQMFDGLIEYNLANYQIEPALATRWSITDSRIYTFDLRRDVRWHDGRPFTADDVVFTYTQIVANPEARGGDAANFEGVKIEKLGDFRVRFTLPKPAPAFIHYMRLPIMPKHKLLPFSQEGGKPRAEINNAWPTNVNPEEVVGTGPFRLRSYTAGQQVTLVKNPNYWKRDAAGNPLPYLDQLQYLIITDSQARVAQFLAGNIGQINITGAEFPDLKRRETQGAPVPGGAVPRAVRLAPATSASTTTPRTPSWRTYSKTATSAVRYSSPSTASASSRTYTTVWPSGPAMGWPRFPSGTTRKWPVCKAGST